MNSNFVLTLILTLLRMSRLQSLDISNFALAPHVPIVMKCYIRMTCIPMKI